MARFLEGPSVQRLAEAAAELMDDAGDSGQPRSVAETAAADWSPLVPMQSEGQLEPLYCIHPVGGDVRCYLDLARHMGTDRPVYVLRARGIEQGLPAHDSVVEMAADYLTAIREAQPQGPYHLSGWSTGGIFAYEMARQLQDQNEKVGTLILIDSPTPAVFEDVDLADDARFLCDLVNFSNYFAGAEMAVSYEKLRCQPPDQRIRTVLDEAIQHKVVPPDVSTDHIRRLIDVCRAHSRSIMEYQPPKLAQVVHIFRPAEVSVLKEASRREIAADLGWDSFATERFNFYQVSGDHFSMMTGENASRLARLIRECMEG
jgi:myxalamid-type polyketide synthase MxaB